MKSIHIEYPLLDLNGEEIILIPGSNFSKLELKFRLKEMDIKDNNSQDKEYLAQLYNSSLNDIQNCAKIIQRLRKDTNNVNIKLMLNQRQSMPSNLNNSNNFVQNKIANISYDVKSYYPNSREQQINIIKPIHTNKGKYVQNPFISSITGQNYSNSYNNEINNRNIRYKDIDKRMNNIIKNDGINVQNVGNKINDLNEKNDYLSNIKEDNLENNNISNINKINNNSSFLSDKNNLFKFRDYNTNEVINSYYNNNDNNNNNFYGSQYSNEEKIDLEDDNKIGNSDNIQNYNNKTKNERLYSNNNENNLKKHSKRLSYQPNALKNDINFNNIKSRKSFPSMPPSININEIPYETVIQNIQKDSSNKEEDNLDNNINNNNENEIKKDPDEVSTFSFFSTFDRFKKYPFYKNTTFIMVHLLILLVILCLFISILHLVNNSWDSITTFFSNIFGFLSESKIIIETITSYVSSLFIGSINYWYITVPAIILFFVFYYFIKKLLFKKRCKEILEKIVNDLRENVNENRSISEEDICKRYSQLYGISYNRFKKKYLPQINKLRRNDDRLKLFSVNNNGNEYIFWDLSE